MLSVSEPHKRKQVVYDITTDDVPEFFANGILVHNSRRYAVASLKVVGVQQSRPVTYGIKQTGGVRRW